MLLFPMKYKYKRIAIIGLPGSGKSTLAVKLGHLLNLPVHHLDVHCFNGRIKRDEKEFRSLQQNIVDQDSWIIEGCSIKTLEMRFARADLIIYLGFSRYLCIWRVIKRVLTQDKHLSDSGCAFFVNKELLQYIWTFKKEKLGRIEELKNKYNCSNFYNFQNPRELNTFLKEIK